MKNKISGFTVIELMIALLIVAIISSFAYSSYVSAARKSKRTDAKTDMMDYVQRIQRCFTVNGTFVTSATEKCQTLDDLEAEGGIESSRGLYSIVATNITVTTYTLTATPVSGRGQDLDADCQTFTLDQAGRKASKNSANHDSTEICW